MKIVVREHPRLYTETELSSFLQISPRDPEGGQRARAQIAGRDTPRDELSDLLLAYNQSIGNDAAALDKIQTLRQDQTPCVITGQQLGFMGGPSYTILKAISCLLLARQEGAVPIFWLATEDHDVGEIDHAYLLETMGNLSKFHLSLPKDGRFVEELQLFPHHFQVIGKFLEAVGLEGMMEAIAGETSYTRAMIRVLVRLFSGTGLVFVEPYLLRPLAKSFFRREIAECDEISRVLQSTTRKLEAAGGKASLDMDEGTNLFLKMEGKYRCKIRRVADGFLVGHERYSAEELLALVEKEPERFSTNAAARTVLQSSLFPTLAYVAGPGEISYYHQLKDYHHFHDVPMPWIVPRVSATFVTPEGQEMLKKCHLEPWDDIPHHWPQVMPSLEEGIEEMRQEWLASGAKYFSEELSADVLERFIRHNTRQLQRKVCMSRLRRQGISPYSLHYLRNLLHPHEKLQERVINWWEFQSETSDNLIQELLRAVDWQTEGHIYCYI